MQKLGECISENPSRDGELLIVRQLAMTQAGSRMLSISGSGRARAQLLYVKVRFISRYRRAPD